jgi:hypothetical protein
MLGMLASGEKVVARYREHSHPLNGLLTDALSRVSSGGRQFLIEEVDFGRPIGESTCVATAAGDEIVYAKRQGRFGLTRFVKNRKPESCSSVVVILKTADNEASTMTMVLVTAFIGRKPEPEPWDRNATSRSCEFWNSHALVWGSEPVVPGTETSQCSW